MASRQDPRHTTAGRSTSAGHRRPAYGPPQKKKQSVPWWGWVIIGFLALKACGTAAPYVTDAPPPATAPTVTTIQGGQ